jgi:hypothetical protein
MLQEYVSRPDLSTKQVSAYGPSAWASLFRPFGAHLPDEGSFPEGPPPTTNIPSSSSPLPPINEAGECRGHCEGAKDGKWDTGPCSRPSSLVTAFPVLWICSRIPDPESRAPVLQPLVTVFWRPVAGSRERAGKIRTGTHKTRTCATSFFREKRYLTRFSRYRFPSVRSGLFCVTLPTHLIDHTALIVLQFVSKKFIRNSRHETGNSV